MHIRCVATIIFTIFVYCSFAKRYGNGNVRNCPISEANKKVSSGILFQPGPRALVPPRTRKGAGTSCRAEKKHDPIKNVGAIERDVVPLVFYGTLIVYRFRMQNAYTQTVRYEKTLLNTSEYKHMKSKYKK